MKNKKKGFSLVELLIVLGISSILMAMSAPKYQGIVGKANELPSFETNNRTSTP